MQILFVTRKYPPNTGGMEKVAFELHKHLSIQHDVTLIRSHRKISGAGAIPFLFLLTFIGLSRRRYDILFLQDGMLSPIVLLGKLFGIPTVMNAHGLDIVYPNLFYQSITKFFISRVDLISCVSSATMQVCLEKGVGPEHLVVIHNGIDWEFWENLKEATKKENGIDLPSGPIILSVGRLVERKGIPWFIREVFPLIARNNKEVNLVIVGDGEVRERVQNMSKNSDYKDRILLLGCIENEKLAMVYQKAAVMISPNIPMKNDIEGFGVNNLESAYFGVPVVASRLDGIQEAVIDGITGILVTPQNAEDFAYQLNRIINGEVIFNREGMKNIVKNQYNWDFIASVYSNEFAKLVDHGEGS